MEKTAVIKVPIPKEFELLAREMGVEEKKLVEAVQRFIVLEAIALESRLTLKDSIKLAEEVEKSAWKKLR